jgi:hypothetical protein
MNTRKMMIGLTTAVLATAVILGLLSSAPSGVTGSPLPAINKTRLENVRDYASAVVLNGKSYAVDGGNLYAGQPLNWGRIVLPEGVIANAVAVDSHNPERVYVGAANELAIYRTDDGGQSWIKAPLSEHYMGGVTDLAVDGVNHVIYVGTDTAGVFRLRDVGSSMISGGHTPLDEPVMEVAADSVGAGLAFVRTPERLLRSVNGGLNWAAVGTLTSFPTAVKVANTTPPTVFVGTVDRGVLKSVDGLAWMSANDGLGATPGARLQVDALAVDPVHPNVLYVATSYLYGSTTLHQSPVGVSVSATGAREWMPLKRDTANIVADLLPMSGATGSVYALTTTSRTPMAMGNAPTAPLVEQLPVRSGWLDAAGVIMIWSVAGLAVLWLLILLASALRTRPTAMQPTPQTVHSGR